MKTRISALAVLLLGMAPLQAAEKLPRDVMLFVEQRDACEHFRGEVPEPEDPERMKEVTRQLDRFCRGTDRRLAQLRKKYASVAVVKQRLAQYESEVEVSSQALAAEKP